MVSTTAPTVTTTPVTHVVTVHSLDLRNGRMIMVWVQGSEGT